MAADLSAATYLVDGVDLQTVDVELTHDGAGLWSGLTEEVGISTSPGGEGGEIDGGVFRPYTHSMMFNVHGNGFDAVWAAIRALRRRCKPGRTVTLVRQVPDPEGTDANVDQTTTARRVTSRVSWSGPDDAVVDVDWWIEEAWFGDAVAIADAAGTHDVDGDVSTHRMEITLAAGAARTITNTTNGHWLTFSAVVPGGGVVIDVEARTAIAPGGGGTDMSQYLSWGKTYPMRLNPGSNTLTVSAGTAAISYQPAYE